MSHRFVGVFENDGAPFSTFCKEHAGAKQGFVALYTDHQADGKVSVCVSGVVPVEGVFNKLLGLKWKVGTNQVSLSATLQAQDEVRQVLSGLGYKQDPYDTKPGGLPLIL